LCCKAKNKADMREREASIVRVAESRSEQLSCSATLLEVGGIQGSSSTLALATLLGIALEKRGSSQPAPFPCDMVRCVAAWGIPNFQPQLDN